MNILITGAGQDSSYLSEILLAEKHNVYVMTRRSCTSNHWRFKKSIDNPNFTFVDGDITDPHTIISFLRSIKVDELYNLAAQSHVGTSFSNPTATWMTTAQGAMNIFEAVKLISPSTLVYQASSSEMFGNMISYIDSIDQFDTEIHKVYNFGLENNIEINLESYHGIYQSFNTPFHPQSPYGVAKLAAHNMARIYREAYGLKIVCGILFNHESSRRGSKFVTRKITKHFARLAQKVNTGWPYLDGPKLKLGNLDICRDWGHASEYVKYMIEMVRDGQFRDRVLATGQTTSILDFVKMTVEVAFKGRCKNPIDDLVEIDDSLKRPAEVPYLKGISEWKPQIKVDQLVEEMVENESFQE